MKPNLRLPILLTALSLLTTIGCSTDTTTNSIPETDMVRVVCAATDVWQDQRITAQMLREELWPADRVPDNAVTNPEDVLGMRVYVPLFEGEPIMAHKLCDPGNPDPPAPIEKHWYVVTVAHESQGGFEKYVGSSPMSEEEFVERFKGSSSILLDDLRAPERLPAGKSRVYVNPKFVVSVRPLTGDPAAQP